jgi:mannosyltransferase
VEANAVLLSWECPTALRDMSKIVRQATTSRPQALAGAGLLILIVLCGSLLRFAGLGNESIWLDETTSILIARLNLPSVVAWTAADIHPPLYYFVLHFWLGFGESEFAVRALSVMFGVWTIVIVYALARELFDSDVGLLSALLLALSPMHIWYSQEARMYPMVTTWSLLASYSLILALRSSSGPGWRRSAAPHRAQMRYWVAYVLFSVLALYTHYFALFVLLFQNLFVLFWLWRHGVRSNASLWRRWLLIELLIALLFLPWVPVVYRQVSGGGGAWVEKSIGRPTVRALLDTWLHFSVGLERQLYPQVLRRFAYVLFALCMLTVAAGLFSLPRTILVSLRRWRSGRSSAILAQQEAATGSRTRSLCSETHHLAGDRMRADTYRTGLWFCVLYVGVPLLTAWLLSQVKPMYSDRYLLPFVPPYCILVAFGIKALKWPWLRWAVVLCLTVTLLVGNWNAWRIAQREDWRWASSYVLAQAQPGDVVLFLPRWLAKPFDYYARGRLTLSMDLPVPVTMQAAQDVATDIAQHYQRAWLVWQRGHYSDPTGLVEQVLDSRFELVEEVPFRGVGSIFLYNLQGTGKGSH